jgi:hypothetical protein
MGMLETRIKRVPEGKNKQEYRDNLQSELDDFFSQRENSCDSCEVEYLNEQNFDEVWEVQETYKNTPEIKERYRGLAKEGKLVYVEIDW